MTTIPTLHEQLSLREMRELNDFAPAWRLEDEGTDHVRLIGTGPAAGMNVLIEGLNRMAVARGLEPKRTSYAITLSGVDIQAEHQSAAKVLRTKVTATSPGHDPVSKFLRPTTATLRGAHLPQEEIGERGVFPLDERRNLHFVRNVVSDGITIQDDYEEDRSAEAAINVFHGIETLRLLAQLNVRFPGYEQYKIPANLVTDGQSTVTNPQARLSIKGRS